MLSRIATQSAARTTTRAYGKESWFYQSKIVNSPKIVDFSNFTKDQFFLLEIVKNQAKKAVHDHFNNPRNIGKLDAKKVNVGTGMVGAPACGDVMKLMIEVKFNFRFFKNIFF